jgi:hypothetical protein
MHYRSWIESVTEGRDHNGIKAFLRGIHTYLRDHGCDNHDFNAFRRITSIAKPIADIHIKDLVKSVFDILTRAMDTLIFEKAVQGSRDITSYWLHLSKLEKEFILRLDPETMWLYVALGEGLFSNLNSFRENFIDACSPELILKCFDIAVEKGQVRQFTKKEFEHVTGINIGAEPYIYNVRKFYKVFLSYARENILDPCSSISQRKLFRLREVLSGYTREFLDRVDQSMGFPAPMCSDL